MLAGTQTKPSAGVEPGANEPGKPVADSACVLWHHPDTTPPRELVASLTKHGANVLPCHDAYSALALACRSSVGPAAGRENGPREARAVLILLLEPAKLPAPGAAAMVRAARRYAPRSACWWYSTAAVPSFRAVTPQDLAGWEAATDANARDNGGESSATTQVHTARGKDAQNNIARPDGPAASRTRPVVVTSTITGPPLRLTTVGVPAQGGNLPVWPGGAGAATSEREPKQRSRPAGPTLGLVGESAEHQLPAEPAPGQALSADELTMLLGEPELSRGPAAKPAPRSERDTK